MLLPPIPENELARLATLRALNILNTDAEERFDRITRLAKRIFSVPICLVSLVDEDRQWFKSCQGLDVTETSRNISFCGHAINHPGVFFIEDASKDSRFADNPLVVDAPHIRFYAGYSLTINHYRVGTLCLIGSCARIFSDEDIETLTDLGKMVEAELLSLSQNISDKLTTISNRRGFELLANKALASCRRQREQAVLFFFDLDSFKEINDNFGHLMGDRLLYDFAHILIAAFRESDVVARLGGDEFVVLLSFVKPDAVDVAIKRFQSLLDQYNQQHPQQPTLASSIGIAHWSPESDINLEVLLDAADKAMYQDKADHYANKP
ncbi:sensor domain-containing diguanylate cyclase [Shewanella xiamenensis]|uniref:sensor domain-containing diguanylate cyclase n=1 Tax=Shewanella xiamenensis TaxID=332186 RepID=UPI0016663393|nr:sensor domain-containing diguanylate cyclase [Shewanella xiamenensis]MCL1070281.1 sensor domain-containing diguanylate cyclase [Shewanella xiamenensis]MCR4534777.1 sensor domain-containing diguanylate cyclase [Shewanella xiamenensis]MEE1980445.1 sensor domain-containing diguanylate cyclase [Shewanella xiamenensis]WHF54923.1 sensor domain-containing diguanylate cyclase [Shewanella xiamenensis]GGM79127.1 GGDEF domain-containing protein [Shewanella xiamenensis]